MNVSRVPVSIRRAIAADVDAVAPLFDAYRQFYGQAPDLQRAREWLRERLRRDESVVLIAERERAAIGTDAFQEAPVFNIMSACSKRTFLVLDPEELEATVRTAFELARSDRPGPVVGRSAAGRSARRAASSP